MLGVMRRCVLGKGPPHFQDFFKLAPPKASTTRSGARRHGRQLIDIRNKAFIEIERRSILGFIWVYNHRPGNVVAANCVSSFQRNLQIFLKERAMAGCNDWRVTQSPRVPVNEHPLR